MARMSMSAVSDQHTMTGTYICGELTWLGLSVSHVRRMER